MSPAELAERLIELVESDRKLADKVRHEAAALREIAVVNPERALERLRLVALEAVNDLAVYDPEEDLSKCVGIENYWAFYVRPEVKAISAATYRLRIKRSKNPEHRLLRDLKADSVLIDAIHSWLVPAAALSGLSGKEVEVALAIRHGPPYSILRFTKDLLLQNEVRVREPRSVDAVPEGLWEWRDGGLASGIRELIDRDIPRTALGTMEWRP